MVDPGPLVLDLRRQVRLLEDDLHRRVATEEVDIDGLRAGYERAVANGRTDATWQAWLGERLTQVAVAWVLGTVFVRFAEDNGLFVEPALTAQDSLLSLFDLTAATPVGRLLLDRQHNPLYQVSISDDAAKELLAFWCRRDADGAPIHDFTDPDLDTGFFADLYEDLSESARKKYALVHTPEFVTELILDLTLEPAITDFGCDTVRIIDPVCGSGQFVLGAFERLLRTWTAEKPELSAEQRVRHAIGAVHGIDLNPFAAAITRFRLLVAAIRACGHTTFEAACDWDFTIAVGDALLGPSDEAPDEETLSNYPRILEPGVYHVVVGNPPYLAVRDRQLHQRYRELYSACSGMYSLTVPFAQQFFRLAKRGGDNGDGAGYVGQLTADSFMKREFGRKLIEEFYATHVALTRVIDTSGAFIPGHGTPTVILIGRNGPARKEEKVCTVIGLRGEPTVPAVPEQGLVWQSILRQSREPNQSDEWTQSLILDREALRTFPWNLADAETTGVLREMSDQSGRLGDSVARIGYVANTGSDDIFIAPRPSFRRLRTETGQALIDVISGSEVRDWTAVPKYEGFWPRDNYLQLVNIEQYPRHLKRLWPYRTVLGTRPNYSTRSYFKDGRSWYDWHHVTAANGLHQWSITFSWVATHNHFALLRDHAAPLQSAPVIKLPEQATQLNHLELVALLNSSTVCFWLKQHSNSKGRPTADQTGSGEPWTEIYEFTATRLRELPLPKRLATRHSLELDRLAQELATVTPAALIANDGFMPERLLSAHARWISVRSRMIALQEELDWEVYGNYGLLPKDGGLLAPPESIPPLNFGERAFEIMLARKAAAGRSGTTWFARHGSLPVTELPEHWPVAYQNVVRRRIDAIEQQVGLGILEKPEFKRRWANDGWDEMRNAALRDWLLDRCEVAELWFDGRNGARHPRPLTVVQLADRLQSDAAVVAAGETLAPGRHLAEVLSDIVANEHVPYLAALRYHDSGLRKRDAWEKVWLLQHDEDASRAAGRSTEANELRDKIPAPPKYSAADFLKINYWRRRGKFDVPNERFLSYPDSPPSAHQEPLIGWAGWDHAEQARVLADLITARIDDLQETTRHRVIPLLAGLREILPWLRQWHPDSARDHATFLAECMQRMSLTEAEVTGWRPQKSRRGRPRKAQ